MEQEWEGGKVLYYLLQIFAHEKYWKVMFKKNFLFTKYGSGTIALWEMVQKQNYFFD